MVYCLPGGFAGNSQAGQRMQNRAVHYHNWQQKLVSAQRTLAAGLAHELNNPAAAVSQARGAARDLSRLPSLGLGPKSAANDRSEQLAFLANLLSQAHKTSDQLSH